MKASHWKHVSFLIICISLLFFGAFSSPAAGETSLEQRVAQLEAVTGARTAENLRKAEEPLSWPLRIMVFLVCAGLPGMFMALYYDSKGARRKSRECWITAVLGLGASVLAGAFLAAISH